MDKDDKTSTFFFTQMNKMYMNIYKNVNLLKSHDNVHGITYRIKIMLAVSLQYIMGIIIL